MNKRSTLKLWKAQCSPVKSSINSFVSPITTQSTLCNAQTLTQLSIRIFCGSGSMYLSAQWTKPPQSPVFCLRPYLKDSPSSNYRAFFQALISKGRKFGGLVFWAGHDLGFSRLGDGFEGGGCDHQSESSNSCHHFSKGGRGDGMQSGHIMQSHISYNHRGCVVVLFLFWTFFVGSQRTQVVATMAKCAKTCFWFPLVAVHFLAWERKDKCHNTQFKTTSGYKKTETQKNCSDHFNSELIHADSEWKTPPRLKSVWNCA